MTTYARSKVVFANSYMIDSILLVLSRNITEKVILLFSIAFHKNVISFGLESFFSFYFAFFCLVYITMIKFEPNVSVLFSFNRRSRKVCMIHISLVFIGPPKDLAAVIACFVSIQNKVSFIDISVQFFPVFYVQGVNFKHRV